MVDILAKATILIVLSSACSAGAEESLKRPDVDHRALPKNFVVKERFTREGTLKDGICEFDPTPQDYASDAQEELILQHDPATCKDVVVRGYTNEDEDSIN